MKPYGCRSAIREIAKSLGKAWLLASFCYLLPPTLQTNRAAAQSTQAPTEQQQIVDVLSSPTLMTRGYRFFFAYQHQLDSVADQLEASGKDASELRTSIQRRLGFSDAEYEPIRTSCDRVVSEIKTLKEEVKSNPGSSASYATVRDQEINAEITTLTNELSAKNKSALDTFIVRMFMPRQEVQKAVQQ